MEFVFEPSDAPEASVDGYVVRQVDSDSIVQDTYYVTKHSVIIASILFLLGLLIHQPTRSEQTDEQTNEV